MLLYFAFSEKKKKYCIIAYINRIEKCVNDIPLFQTFDIFREC